MMESFYVTTRMIMKTPEAKLQAQFRQFFKNIETVLNKIDESIPATHLSTKKYASFIREKTFFGISNSDKFQTSKKSRIKMVINSANSEQSIKMYSKILELSVLESKNLIGEYEVDELSNVLDSLNSLDGVLYERTQMVNKSLGEIDKYNFSVIDNTSQSQVGLLHPENNKNAFTYSEFEKNVKEHTYVSN